MTTMAQSSIHQFVRESNWIENITRAPTRWEREAHEHFLALPEITVADLEMFVGVIAPGHGLRTLASMNVTVGKHRPPAGGPGIAVSLAGLLRANYGPYATHVHYELLHPFLDGNGRSGRALWAWQMQRAGQDPFAMPFLRAFYYQTLDAAR